MVDKNFKYTITKRIFIHIFRISNVVAHFNWLYNGPPHFLSGKECPKYGQYCETRGLRFPYHKLRLFLEMFRLTIAL